MLVLGFGPFGEVRDNPARRAALAVDGVEEEGLQVFGEEMPVSYRRAPALALARAEALGVDAIVGIGVAVSRSGVEVERLGRNRLEPSRPDVDDEHRDCCAPDGPACIEASLDALALADALGAAVSEDAGTYVCNAWLYEVTRRAPPGRRVAFVHVPPDGLAPDRLLSALRTVLAGERSGG